MGPVSQAQIYAERQRRCHCCQRHAAAPQLFLVHLHCPTGSLLTFPPRLLQHGFAHLAANPLSNHKGGWQSQCPDPENLLAFRAPGRSKQATGCPVTPAVSEAASAEQGACHAARAKGPGATFSVEGK